MLGLTTATLFEMRSSHSNCIFDSFETIVAHLGYISGLKAERIKLAIVPIGISGEMYGQICF